MLTSPSIVLGDFKVIYFQLLARGLSDSIQIYVFYFLYSRINIHMKKLIQYTYVHQKHMTTIDLCGYQQKQKSTYAFSSKSEMFTSIQCYLWLFARDVMIHRQGIQRLDAAGSMMHHVNNAYSPDRSAFTPKRLHF